ncbi:MAG: protein kinase [Deltaproteobacteria bacterium]|nr:protein kinase [Deltaproteobacteria bacterium]
MDLLDGRLSAEVTEEVERHISRCPECRRLLSALTKATIADSKAPSPPGPRSAGSAEGPDATPVADRATAFAPGTTVDGFLVLRWIGAGGMGEVYLARDLKLGRKVALKLIRPARLGSPAVVERFLSEARLTATFSHPHIVTLYSLGEHEGQPYAALEYVEGDTLQQRLGEERLGPAQCVRIGLAIAEALAEAHRHGILHRDLKPANIMLAKDGRLRVLDFGLAKALQEASAAVPDTALFGSPLYMAPEQWRVERCTTATDLWAWGVIFYRMLEGRLPYQATSLSGQRELVLGGGRPPLGSGETVPPDVLERMFQCLSTEPSARPSAEEVVETLKRAALGRRASTPAAPSPFRGLLPFAERHAASFFGREREVAALLERLRDEPLLTIAGPSGAGKSSFVQAGLIPGLRESGRWTVLGLRPGREPFLALAERLVHGESSGGGSGSSPEEARQLAEELRETPSALGLWLQRLALREGSRVVLFVDQLEELFTQGADEVVRRSFVQALLTAADDPAAPVRVLLTIRDDFLYRLVESSESAEALERVTFLRLPDESALRELLVRPLEVHGYRFEDPELANEMVADVRGESACLPLLQFAAQALWEERDEERRLLLRERYRELGGVVGALAHHADSVLSGLSAGEVGLARELLLRLVSAEGTRRVLPQDEVLEGLAEGASEVLRRLVQARLLTVRKAPASDPGRAELELVHEALIRVWTRLARWVEESREGFALLAELRQAAELWERRGRRDEEVWQGQAIQDALRAVERRPAPVSSQVSRFLEAGLKKARARRRRRRAASVAAGGLLLVVALASLTVAWALHRARRTAEEERRLAVEQRSSARHRLAEALQRSATLALLRGAPLEARVKLRSSLELEDAMPSRALLRQLDAEPLLWKQEVGSVAHDLAFSPDGRRLAVATHGKTIQLFEVETGAGRVLRGHADQVLSLAFSRDGRLLASGSWSGEVRLWELASGQAKLLVGHQGAVFGVAFRPDGELLASAGADGLVRLWDPRAPGAARVLRGPGRGSRSVVFSPDGRTLAVVGAKGVVHLWEPRSGTLRRTLRSGAVELRQLAFSPDGRWLAGGGSDQRVHVWDARSEAEEPAFALPGHGGTVASVSFSPDGRTLASGSYDQSIRLWDLETRVLLRQLEGHGSIVLGVRFSPDGSRLASCSYDQTVRLWRLGGTPDPRLEGHTGGVLGLAFSPDGRRIASGGADRSVRLWDVSRGAPTRVLRGHENTVSGVSFAADGQRLATASYDGTVRLWDARSGAEQERLLGHRDKVRGVAFGPGGTRLASYGEDRTIRVWELGGGPPRGVRLPRTLDGHAGTVFSASFSADGRWLASASADRTVRVWDLASGACRAVLRGHSRAVWGVGFSPDGSQLVSSGEDGTVRLWNRTGTRSRVLLHEGLRFYWLAFHPDGGRVGVAASDGTVRIVQLATGRTVALKGHRGEVAVVRFSPDGAQAVTSGDDGTVRLWDATSGRPVWRTALVRSSPPELRVLGGGEVLLTEGAKERRVRVTREPGLTAAARVEEGFALGFEDGTIDLAPAEDGARRPRTRFERGTAGSPVLRLIPGPRETLVVGHASGLVALWDLRTGVRLEELRLHGAVQHLSLVGSRLQGASELGDARSWDLGLYALPYCELLVRVWREVPLRAEGPAFVLQPVPPDHPCRPR